MSTDAVCAQALLKDAEEEDDEKAAVHPADEKYGTLGAQLALVSPNSHTCKSIATYCSNTMGYKVELQVGALACERSMRRMY